MTVISKATFYIKLAIAIVLGILVVGGYLSAIGNIYYYNNFGIAIVEIIVATAAWKLSTYLK